MTATCVHLFGVQRRRGDDLERVVRPRVDEVRCRRGRSRSRGPSRDSRWRRPCGRGSRRSARACVICTHAATVNGWSRVEVAGRRELERAVPGLIASALPRRRRRLPVVARRRATASRLAVRPCATSDLSPAPSSSGAWNGMLARSAACRRVFAASRSSATCRTSALRAPSCRASTWLLAVGELFGQLLPTAAGPPAAARG